MALISTKARAKEKTKTKVYSEAKGEAANGAWCQDLLILYEVRG